MAYDVIVLGSGPGGYPAAIRASQLGKKVAIVEKESLGGICLNWGCIPTKALIKSANVLEYLAHAQDYGVKVDGFSADFNAVIKRSRGVADKMSKGIQFLMKKNKIDVIMGYGKLLAPGKLEVTAADNSKQIVEAKNIRFLLFHGKDNDSTYIDLNTKNDSHGLILFQPGKKPHFADMMNIDTELGYYFKNRL